MNNKIKNTRVVTFKENYYSKPAMTIAAKAKVEAEPIYIKGSTHAMHKNIAAKIQEKMGADVEVKAYPYDQALAAAKKAFDKRKAQQN